MLMKTYPNGPSYGNIYFSNILQKHKYIQKAVEQMSDIIYIYHLKMIGRSKKHAH